MFKTKSLLTKATSPSCWSVVLPGQGNPAGIHEAAPQNGTPRPFPAAATSSASLPPWAQPRRRPRPSAAARPALPPPPRQAGRLLGSPPPPKKTPKSQSWQCRKGLRGGCSSPLEADTEEARRARRRSGDPGRAAPCPAFLRPRWRGAAGGCWWQRFPIPAASPALPPCQPLFWARPRSLPKLFKSPWHVGEHRLAWGRARRPPCPPLPTLPAPPRPPRARPCPDRAAGDSAPGGQIPREPCWGGGRPCLAGRRGAGRAPAPLVNPLFRKNPCFQSRPEPR